MTKTYDLPDVGETKVHLLDGGRIMFVKVYQDSDIPNPIEDWDGMGKILSLGRRHRNFDPAGVTAAMENDPDAVPLGYFEHGNCLWFVRGEAPPGADCPWDGVGFAGVWVPDEETRKRLHEKYPDVAERRKAFVEYARSVCKTYTEWCNGEVYGYQLEVYRTRWNDEASGEFYDQEVDYRFDTPLHEDSCGGFFGYEHLVEELRSAITHAEGVIA